jgi:hypothetical protein
MGYLLKELNPSFLSLSLSFLLSLAVLSCDIFYHAVMQQEDPHLGGGLLMLDFIAE